MKKYRKGELAIVAIVFALALFLGCLQQGFEEGYSGLKKVDAKFMLDGTIVPADLKSLESYRLELLSLKVRAEARPKSRTRDALLQIVGIKLDMADMEAAFIIAGQEAMLADLANPDCNKNAHLKDSLDAYDIAMAKSALAKQKIEAFNKSFSGEAKKVGLNPEDLAAGLDAMSATAKQLKENILQYCAAE